MKLYIEHHGIQRNTRVLHFAPESGLFQWLRQNVDDYVTADFDIVRYSHISQIKHVDLTNPESYGQFGLFDLILHNHVIEHIPYNYSALLLRLHRMLRPGGVQAFSIPIYGAFYAEHWGPLSPEEATQRFGQFDHIRRFSPKDIDRTIGAFFELRQPDLASVFGIEKLREINYPEADWASWTGNSIFWLDDKDCCF
jgi:phosphoglycolate phosphatase